jgi:hypothetical protein
MSFRKGNVIVLRPEEPDVCELCGKVDELRPYGPNGKRICFDCGQKDPKTTSKMCNQVLFGDSDKVQ